MGCGSSRQEIAAVIKNCYIYFRFILYLVYCLTKIVIMKNRVLVLYFCIILILYPILGLKVIHYLRAKWRLKLYIPSKFLTALGLK